MALKANIRVEGLRETQRAFDQLAAGAQDELRDAATTLMRELEVLTKAAGRAEGRQAKLAAETVEVVQTAKLPYLRAGGKGPKRNRDVTKGSEFGATRRFGWYAKGRYYNSRGRQYRPHRGASSYWFFRTTEENGQRISAAYEAALDSIARKWAKGG